MPKPATVRDHERMLYFVQTITENLRKVQFEGVSLRDPDLPPMKVRRTKDKGPIVAILFT